MFENYLKTAIRNLQRNKPYAIINTLGLAVGIAACLLLFLVIRFETSYDQFHPKKDHIYRIGTELHSQDGLKYTAGAPLPTAGGIRIDFPQIKEVASIFNKGGQVTIDNGAGQSKKFMEDRFFYVEPSFFSMFNFPWIAGTPETSLKNPNDVALTRDLAEKYFGDWKQAIGKTIKIDNSMNFTVRGILENTPPNTDFPLGIMAPYSGLSNTYFKANLDDWVSTFGEAYTFVVLPPELSQDKFNAALKVFSKKHKPAEYAADAPYAQPLKEIHHDDRFGNFRGHTFSYAIINALSLIGLFLLVIACVNFINLATAQAVNRSKEVGVRKVLGSNRKQLALQFLMETALITLFAIFIAIVLATATLPFLNKLLEVEMSLNFISNPSLLFFLVLAALFTTLLSGIYPAIILSGFNPITALKNKMNAKMTGGISLRRGLVIFQFVIAHILIIGMLIVVYQMDFFRNASMGFEKAAILNVGLPGDSTSRSRMAYVQDQLLKIPEIKSLSFSFASPTSENNWGSDFKYDHAAKVTDFGANLKWADTAYFGTFNLKFLAGRPYYPSDTVKEFVVNETLLRKLGVRDPQEAVGKEINFWNGAKVGKIVGVIRDFNSYSLRKPMAPVILSTWKDVYQTINIRINPGGEKAALPRIEKIWTTAFPDYVYEYKFLDNTIENFYKQENQLSILYKIFAGIAIFISCLGLYGLVSFMTLQRTKEIGIRKVLGASAGNIVYLLSREFTLLILVAFVLAAPIAYYVMNNWLQNYTYRFPLGVSIFMLAIIGSMLISWITVGYQAVHAAFENPVKSLRTE